MNIEKHNFITLYLRHRSACTAYCLAYNIEDQSQYESIMSAANQLMDDPEVGGVIRSVLEGVRYDVEQEIRAHQKTELLTVQRKRELLANIATGEMYAVQTYKGKDCTQCTQMVHPTINQMLKAIDLDNKLAGHYSADKRQLTDESPKPQQITTNELSPTACHLEENTLEPQQNTTKNAPLGAGVNKTPSLPPVVAEKGSQTLSTVNYEALNSAYPPYQQGSPIRQTAQK